MPKKHIAARKCENVRIFDHKLVMVIWSITENSIALSALVSELQANELETARNVTA